LSEFTIYFILFYGKIKKMGFYNMTQIQTEIKELLVSLGVSDVGFCHTQADDGIGGLENAVSIVVHLSDAILDEVVDKPTHTYFNHYRSVNAFIDHCLLRVGLLLDRHGYKYITVASSQSINDEGWHYRGRYSHKKIACLAGLGNMGNNGLFLHKDFGARVRLGTLFTDCQFENPTEYPKDLCSHCNICKEKCPSGAISGKNWSTDRESYFNAAKCSEFMKREYKNIGRGAVCGLCVSHCPYGR